MLGRASLFFLAFFIQGCFYPLFYYFRIWSGWGAGTRGRGAIHSLHDSLGWTEEATLVGFWHEVGRRGLEGNSPLGSAVGRTFHGLGGGGGIPEENSHES